MPTDPFEMIFRKPGDWWGAEYRRWCAYCGRQMRKRKGPSPAKTCATHDHVIAKAHGGAAVTIPCCRACNESKGTLGLAEFLASPYFNEIRSVRHKRQWPVSKLWFALALAAFHLSKDLERPMESKKTG